MGKAYPNHVNQHHLITSKFLLTNFRGTLINNEIKVIENLLISVSQVAWIAGVSHQSQAKVVNSQ
jgi:hypothetical protein